MSQPPMYSYPIVPLANEETLQLPQGMYKVEPFPLKDVVKPEGKPSHVGKPKPPTTTTPKDKKTTTPNKKGEQSVSQKKPAPVVATPTPATTPIPAPAKDIPVGKLVVRGILNTPTKYNEIIGRNCTLEDLTEEELKVILQTEEWMVRHLENMNHLAADFAARDVPMTRKQKEQAEKGKGKGALDKEPVKPKAIDVSFDQLEVEMNQVLEKQANIITELQLMAKEVANLPKVKVSSTIPITVTNEAPSSSDVCHCKPDDGKMDFCIHLEPKLVAKSGLPSLFKKIQSNGKKVFVRVMNHSSALNAPAAPFVALEDPELSKIESVVGYDLTISVIIKGSVDGGIRLFSDEGPVTGEGATTSSILKFVSLKEGDLK